MTVRLAGIQAAEERAGGTKSSRVTARLVAGTGLPQMSRTAPSESWTVPGTPRAASCARLRLALMAPPAAVLDEMSARVRLADSPRMVISG